MRKRLRIIRRKRRSTEKVPFPFAAEETARISMNIIINNASCFSLLPPYNIFLLSSLSFLFLFLFLSLSSTLIPYY